MTFGEKIQETLSMIVGPPGIVGGLVVSDDLIEAKIRFVTYRTHSF